MVWIEIGNSELAARPGNFVVVETVAETGNFVAAVVVAVAVADVVVVVAAAVELENFVEVELLGDEV